jgi:hypothetical protein
MAYRPERPVTSEKIRDKITRELGKDGRFYKRAFKSRLVVSRNWVRGYISNVHKAEFAHVLAISNPEDTKLLEVYFVLDAKRAATSLGIEEILTSE